MTRGRSGSSTREAAKPLRENPKVPDSSEPTGYVPERSASPNLSSVDVGGVGSGIETTCGSDNDRGGQDVEDLLIGGVGEESCPTVSQEVEVMRRFLEESGLSPGQGHATRDDLLEFFLSDL